jgi:hypothetical protein
MNSGGERLKGFGDTNLTSLIFSAAATLSFDQRLFTFCMRALWWGAAHE